MATSATPPRIPSDEATREQLRLAKAEGDAYRRSLDYMVGQVADNGASKNAGDYLVAIAQERAEGMYALADGKLDWQEPGNENCHIEVSVSDAADHRFIPELDIEVVLTPASGTPVGPFKAPFLWHPGLFHYGADVTVPGDGRYDVKITIAAPTFMRHDKTNGSRYADPVSVTFTDFAIKVGQE